MIGSFTSKGDTTTNDLNNAHTNFRKSNLLNSPTYKLASFLHEQIQLTIIKVDVLLERIRLETIRLTNCNTNNAQKQLFFLSMWVSRRFNL